MFPPLRSLPTRLFIGPPEIEPPRSFTSHSTFVFPTLFCPVLLSPLNKIKATQQSSLISREVVSEQNREVIVPSAPPPTHTHFPPSSLLVVSPPPPPPHPVLIPLLSLLSSSLFLHLVCCSLKKQKESNSEMCSTQNNQRRLWCVCRETEEELTQHKAESYRMKLLLQHKHFVFK